MPTREEIRSLAQDIVGSYEDRMKGIAQLQKDVSTRLQGFERELKEVRAARVSSSHKLRVGLAKSAADLKQEVHQEIEDVHAARAAASQELRAGLAKSAADLKQEVHQEIEDVHAARAVASKELRAELAKSAADLKQEVHQKIEDVHAARAAASQELRVGLAKSAADLKQEVGTLLKGFGMKLAEVRATLAGGRDEWQKMTATMQSKRGGVAVAVKPPIEEIAEAAVPKVEAAEITQDLAAVRDRVFEHLANHPDGTKLVELEQEFGLARIQMSRVIRSLIEENKVEKRGLLYFAI